MPELFGRTNVRLPAVWLSPRLPEKSEELAMFGERLAQTPTVIDVSGQLALWGSFLRQTNNPVMAIGSEDALRSTSERHASDLTEANLLQILSSIGRETLDFYFLPVRRAWEEYQLSGVFSALESARSDGHLRFIGLAAESSPLAALGVWQFHDAFEAVLCDEAGYSQLSPLARERRVGVLGRNLDADARLATVNSIAQLEGAMGALER